MRSVFLACRPSSNRRLSNMSIVTTSTLVARRFLKMADPNDPPLTQLKLMKMCFFAHGWYLGIYSEPLIDEDVLAWPHGPVFEDLYHETKKYQSYPVSDVPKSEREIFYENRKESKVKDNGLKIIKGVNKVYKKNTAWQLRELTHRKGSPWDTTRIIHDGIDDGPIIENDLIQEYYSKQITGQ